MNLINPTSNGLSTPGLIKMDEGERQERWGDKNQLNQIEDD